MKKQMRWRWGVAAALAVCLLAGVLALWPQPQEAVPVFAALPAEENLFAQPVETPGFSIEVISIDRPAVRSVLIYHTHTYEAFEQVDGRRYKETEKWRTADSSHNMIRVGEELAALLRALGIRVTHDTTAFEPPTLSSAYARSLDMLEKRLAAGESYDLYIDLHRDAYSASYGGSNTVNIAGSKVAKLMLLIGKGEGAIGQGYDQKPDWQANLAIAQAITDGVNGQSPGLCREVCLKTGRYNQHIAPACILVEAGNNKNTLDEVLAAMPYLADAVAQFLQAE